MKRLVPLCLSLVLLAGLSIHRVQASGGETALAASAYSDTDLSIFPNPVKNGASISFSGDVERVAILNIVGREVMAYEVDPKTGKLNVNLSDLEPGVYFLTAQAKGRNLVTKRFMKEL